MPYAPSFDPNVWSGQIDAMENVGGGGGQGQQIGGSVYYNQGFLPAGGGQVTQGGTLWSNITAGLSTVLPALFGGSASSGVPATVPTVRTPATFPSATGTAIRGVMGAVTKAATQHPVLTAAGGAAATVGGAVLARRMGRKAPTVTQHPDGSVTVRHHRRMNPCNIKALRRAIRRAHGFEKVCRRVMHFTSPHKVHHTAVFKRSRRKR